MKQRIKVFAEKTQNIGKNKKVWMGGVGVVVVAVVLSVFIFSAKGATFGWFQTDWSGGADTNAVANHTSNQNGWTKFFSKDANVDVTTTPGEAKITQTQNSYVTTTDTDFNAGTKTQVYVSGSGASGAVYAQKPIGGTCAVNAECADGYCNATVCANAWQNVSACRVGGGGTGNTMLVYSYDVAGTSQWKTSNTSCVGPQCSGSPAVLVADNAVDFSVYPARNACKAVGGRLPTLAELACIYTNKASYIGAWQASYYWSATEVGASAAWNVYFPNGGQNSNMFSGKNYSNYVRCVQGQ